MPDDWSKLRDVGPLADGHAELAFSIPSAAFPRTASQLVGDGGTLDGRVRFSRSAGLALADIDLHGEVTLTCQRCLKPMRWPIADRSRVALVSAEAETDQVPEGLETVLAPEGRISLRDLVEEDFMLSLPIVPLHADPADCGVESGPAAVSPDEPETVQRPFERLASC